MSKKYVALIPMLLLLAACSPEAEEPAEETSVEEVEVEAEEDTGVEEWQIAYSDDAWNGALITIEDDTVFLERELPESSLTVFASYDLEEDEADYFKAENVSTYEVFIPNNENGDLPQDAASPFQTDQFNSEEKEDGTLFNAENIDTLEGDTYLAPDALHIYKGSEDRLEVVVIDETPAVVLGVSPEEDLEESQNLSALYHSLNQSLLEVSTQGIENARGSLDEILSLTSESQLAAYHSDLIDHAEQYVQAVKAADGETMQSKLAEMETLPYSNLYGVYDTYFSLQENVVPYLDIVSDVDRQLELASGYLDNGQIEDAERALVQISGITDILNSYYPAKAERLTSVQSRLVEAQEAAEAQAAQEAAEAEEAAKAQASSESQAIQSQVNFEDFLGYWGNVEAPYASISPGQEMLYISHNYYASFVMNSDVGFSGQIQGSSIDGNTLYLDVFSKGLEPDVMYPEGVPDIYQTVALTLKEENGSPFISIDIDGFMILYYPVDREEAIYFMGGDMEENLNRTYQ